MVSDEDRLPITTRDGPGSDPNDPIAIIIKDMHSAESLTHALPASKSSQPSISFMLQPFSHSPRRLGRHAPYVYCCAFSPDGSQIVSGSFHRTICLWDADSGQLTTGPISVNADVYSAVFSPDGRHIALGLHNPPYIRIWDVCIKALLGTLSFEGHTHAVRSIAYFSDGQKIVSGSWDGAVMIWDVKVGKALVRPMRKHKDCVASVAVSPDETRIVSGSWDYAICIWNAKTGELLTFLKLSNIINSVALSPNGRWVASGCYGGEIVLWDTEDGNSVGSAPSSAIRHCRGHSDGVASVVFSPDGQWIVSGSYDRTVRIWGVESGEAATVFTLPGNTHHNENSVYSASVSPQGDRIVAGTYDGSIYMWSRMRNC